MDWDNSKQLYKVSSKDSQTQAVFEDSARVVISAIGVLNVPSFPRELEGIRDFKGSAFHSAQWDHSIDLKNKRVAVIGNGCSASVVFFPISPFRVLTAS